MMFETPIHKPFPGMTDDEWKAIHEETTRQMIVHAGAFATPISTQLPNEAPRLVGTGGYVEIDGARLLLTNEHITFKRRMAPLGHTFAGTEYHYQLAEPRIEVRDPIDAAVVAISDETWCHAPHNGAAIPASRIADRHAPVQRELFFLIGFAGERARYMPLLGDVLISRGTPYATQEVPADGSDPDIEESIKSEFFDAQYHFALLHRPDRTTVLDP